nr:GerMN domain-containing protein [Alkalibacter mobilis]
MFFYPSLDDETYYYQTKPVEFETNDITRKVLEKEYKNESPSTVLTENTEINWLYLNNDGMVYIDVSGDFVTEMNAGAAYESMILQALANTIGNYYGVERILLTLDGDLYESGHILLQQGEYLTVNMEDAEELE